MTARQKAALKNVAIWSAPMLATALLSILVWLGKVVYDDTQTHTRQLIQVETSMKDVEKHLEDLKESVVRLESVLLRQP